MRAISWGRLLAAETTSLSAVLASITPGCAPSALPAAPEAKGPGESAAPDASSTPALLPDPPGSAAGLGPFAALGEGSASVPLVPSERQSFDIESGTLWFFGFASQSGGSGLPPACPAPELATAECRGLRFYPRAGGAPPPPGPLVGLDWHRWESFTPARGRVFAFRPQSLADGAADRQGFAVDTVDPQGRVRTIAELDAEFSMSFARLFETAEGLLAVGATVMQDGYISVLGARTIRGGDAAAHAAAGKRRSLRLAVDLVNAQQAREARRRGLHATFGPWAAAALEPSPGSRAAAALAWVEAFPPPYASAPAEAPRSTGKLGRSRGECGRVSRGLGDRTVRKQPHLALLSDEGAVLVDRAVRVPLLSEDDEPRLSLSASGDEITLNGARFRLSRSPPAIAPIAPIAPIEAGAAQQAAPAPAFEQAGCEDLLAAAFDPASGQAAVLVGCAGPEPSKRLFTLDALGRLRGPPVMLKAPLPRTFGPPPALARVGRSWVSVDAAATALSVLGEDGANTRFELSWPGEPHARALLGLARRGDDAEVLVLQQEPTPSLVHARIALASGKLTPEGEQFPLSTGAEDSAPAQILARLSRAGRWEVYRAGAGSEVERMRESAAGFSRDALEFGDVGSGRELTLARVWDDGVLLLRGQEGEVAVWAERGISLRLPKPTGEPPRPPPRDAGPVLHGGRELLAEAPAAPTPSPEGFASAAVRCAYVLPTGPRRLLLVCSEPSGDGLGLRPGVRLLRY